MSENDHQLGKKREVRIHIDREPYDSPSPTTGCALYRLAEVANHHELFREVEGDQEDAFILDDETEVHLKHDEHFYTHNDFKIVVNGREKVVTKNRLSFDEVVILAFTTPPNGPNIMFTITYRNGPRQNPEGTLSEGGKVKIKDGMIFNVTATDKS